MEFRGIIHLNPQTAYQFAEYVSEKESELSLKLMETISLLEKKSSEPTPPIQRNIKLTEALSFIGKEMRQLALEKIELEEASIKQALLEIRGASWHYLEILENSESELFLQVKLLGIEAYTPEIEESVSSIKKTLMQHLDNFYWGLKRLNKEIKTLTSFSDKKMGFFKKIVSSFSSPLDAKLFSNLEKSKKFLSFNYQNFYRGFLHYQKLLEGAKKKGEKLKECTILNYVLDDASKASFQKVYEGLNMLLCNQKQQLISEKDLNHHVKLLTDPKRMFHILEEYQNGLLREAFEKSRLLKSKRILQDGESRKGFIDQLKNRLKEVHLLVSMADQYRELLRQTDKDPYVRVKMGFTDETTGKEPPLIENLRNLSEEEELSANYFNDLIKAVSKNEKSEDVLSQVKEKCEELLHEMGQPLISESTMKQHALKILDQIKHLDELGSSSWRVVDFVGRLLSKLLKYDWKYHVLFSLPEFLKAYDIHIGILNKEHEDRPHLNRMDEFRRLLKEVKDFIKSKEYYKDREELKFILNDIRGSLQDFFGYAQNALQESGRSPLVLQTIAFQLMEYRYFFGRYFYEMEQSERDPQWIKKEFLFVDQYLEAVEGILN